MSIPDSNVSVSNDEPGKPPGFLKKLATKVWSVFEEPPTRFGKELTEAAGRACAVLAAASFAAILEADQIERVRVPDDLWRTAIYCCLSTAIPINIFMYDYLLEKNIGRVFIFHSKFLQGCLVRLGWGLSGFGFFLLILRLSKWAGVLFALIEVLSIIFYVTYEDLPILKIPQDPEQTGSGNTEEVTKSTTPSP